MGNPGRDRGGEEKEEEEEEEEGLLQQFYNVRMLWMDVLILLLVMK